MTVDGLGCTVWLYLVRLMISWSGVLQALGAFALAVIAGYLGARWQGRHQVDQWHRQQRLEALVAFLQGLDGVRRMLPAAIDLAHSKALGISLEDARRQMTSHSYDLDAAGTKLELLCTPAVNEPAADLWKLWLDAVTEVLNDRSVDASALRSRERPTMVTFMKAARRELGFKADAYARSGAQD